VSSAPIPPAIKFVLATILINAIGFGVILPVLPRLVMALGHVSISRAGVIGGWISMLYAAMQFLFGPVVGNLSDRFGRRPVLLGSLSGFAIDFLIIAFAPSLIWLFVGRLFAGLFGATNGPAQSAIADMAPPGERTRLFGYIGAAFGIGFVVGPVIGGLLSGFGTRAPFYAAAALAGCNFVYGWINFPETLAPENRRSFEWRRANPVGALLHVRKLSGILPISTVYFLWQVASMIYPVLWGYFTIAQFGWSSQIVGLSLAWVGLCMALSQIFLSGRVVARFGERRTAMIGLTSGASGMIFMAVIHNGWLVIPGTIFIALQSLVHPSLTGMISRRATPDTQGEVQGFASSVLALGAIMAPAILSPAFGYFTSDAAPFRFAGAPFVIAAGFAMVALLILTRTAPAVRADPALVATT
jgi:MFS transporter, DHA1 family, tetracycline resistance protein